VELIARDPTVSVEIQELEELLETLVVHDTHPCIESRSAPLSTRVSVGVLLDARSPS
jgi:hypothetical protein